MRTIGNLEAARAERLAIEYAKEKVAERKHKDKAADIKRQLRALGRDEFGVRR
jgi:hypothetical protein